MIINTVKFTKNAQAMAAVINGVVTNSTSLCDYFDLNPQGFKRS